MRRYDDPVEVRQGWIGSPDAGMEGPEQFLWRGRLWQVRAVLAHWVETGPWWQTSGVRAVLGSEEPGPTPSGSGQAPTPAPSLLREREMWRVEAGRGRDAGREVGGDVPRRDRGEESPGGGVFDLSFDWGAGSWQLVGCVD